MAHVDVISDVLAATLRAFPDSEFLQGLSHQYLVRGGLSKKQMEGLYGKASKLKDLSPAKLATLQAIILKKPTRYRSALPQPSPLYEGDTEAEDLVAEILRRYPQHKRVLYFQSKQKNRDPLTKSEAAELQKFGKLLLK